MMTYKDMTFCRVECENHQCQRHETQIPRNEVGDYKTGDLPISWGTFHAPPALICKVYQPPVPRGEN